MEQLTILVVEDDKLNRALVTTALEEGGYIVHCAQSISDCRAMLERERPSVIVLDRGLPDGDGSELCMALKKDPLFKSIPIIMLTGDVDVADKTPGFGWGADDYLAKPYDIDELRCRVGAIAKKDLRERGGRERHGPRP